MRRAAFAGAALGIVAGLLFVYHDSLALSVAWPILLGFALWEAVGHRGARAAFVALAAAAGLALAYVTFVVVAELLPVTATGLGIAVGVAVGVLVIAGVMLRDRLPLPALLVGYATFIAVFEPRWREAAASIRLHGFEDLTVALLGLLAGILTATLLRAIVDAGRETDREPSESRDRPVGDVAMRGGTP